MTLALDQNKLLNHILETRSEDLKNNRIDLILRDLDSYDRKLFREILFDCMPKDNKYAHFYTSLLPEELDSIKAYVEEKVLNIKKDFTNGDRLMDVMPFVYQGLFKDIDVIKICQDIGFDTFMDKDAPKEFFTSNYFVGNAVNYTIYQCSLPYRGEIDTLENKVRKYFYDNIIMNPEIYTDFK